jgi:Reverse transcriptase (RNA-dependent DNA polymerase)
VYRDVREILKARGADGQRFKYGVRLPIRAKDCADLDKENGNNKWMEANQAELALLDEFEAFKDCGEYTEEKAQALRDQGYQFIKLMMIYDVKHDGRFRARLVAAGNMTRPGCDAYSLVVSFRTLRLAMLIGELNSLKLMVGDVTSAYLMAMTKELIFFKAGPEFMEKEGHLMIVKKSLYGLRTSSKSWHDLLFDTLSDTGFRPSFADPDIWMRDAGQCYEYVCSYVDDLTAIMVNPQGFFDELERRGFGLNLKLRGAVTCSPALLQTPLPWMSSSRRSRPTLQRYYMIPNLTTPSPVGRFYRCLKSLRVSCGCLGMIRPLSLQDGCTKILMRVAR